MKKIAALVLGVFVLGAGLGRAEGQGSPLPWYSCGASVTATQCVQVAGPVCLHTLGGDLQFDPATGVVSGDPEIAVVTVPAACQACATPGAAGFAPGACPASQMPAAVAVTP